MGVSNGQVANQTTFNNAFMARNNDTDTIGKVDLLNPEAESGDTIDNIQRELNSLASFVGKPTEVDFDYLPVWVDTSVGTGTDSLEERTEALTAEFNPSTGHTHDGSDSALVNAVSIDEVRLRGSFVRGTNLTAVTGSSTDVSTEMSSKTPSTSDTTKGVVVLPPNNRVIIRDLTTGDDLLDAFGNMVYGRIVESTGTWTLFFYVDIAGVETAYSAVAQDIAWYYQELFNPITDAPIYSELAVTPSDNATQDVVDASPSQRGLVSTGTQSFGGVKTFADTTQSTTKDNGGVVLEGGLGVEKNINAGGNIAATGTVTGSNLSGTNTGDITLGTFGTTPDAKGATLSSQVLTLQPADATHPGLMGFIAQTLGGVKTWVAGQIYQAYVAYNRGDTASTASIAQLSSATSFRKITGSTLTTIHGIAAGADGQAITIHNGTSVTVTLAHQSLTATAADRLILPNGDDIDLESDTSIEFIYDTAQSRWVIKSGSGSGSGATAFGMLSNRNSNGDVTVEADTALTVTFFNISTGDTYTIEDDGAFVALGDLSIDGDLVVGDDAESTIID